MFIGPKNCPDSLCSDTGNVSSESAEILATIRDKILSLSRRGQNSMQTLPWMLREHHEGQGEQRPIKAAIWPFTSYSHHQQPMTVLE